MTTPPLTLSVVGHTNTGKTSLLRTLLRDSTFGEVKNAPSTTRHVEQAAIIENAETLALLFDTPGLEDAGGLLDWLERHTPAHADGIERLQQFLDSPQAQSTFSQEAKVLRQVLQSDTALYVIDAREPVLEKYKDELTVLSWCAKPLMPVFNFTSEHSPEGWTEMLARRALHVYTAFDTVAFDFDSEIRLWQNLATMLPKHGRAEQIINMRRREWQHLNQNARLEIADFLLEAAALRQECSDGIAETAALEQLQTAIRNLERQMQQRLTALYRFYQNDILAENWMPQSITADPFDSELLKQYGVRTGTGATAGALIGLGIDIAALGGTLGLGTAIGSLIGGVLPNIQEISDKFSGKKTLYASPETLTVLAARALELLAVIQSRGHAAQQRIELKNRQAPWPPQRLPDEIAKARGRPKWSSYNGSQPDSSRSERRPYAESLSAKLP